METGRQDGRTTSLDSTFFLHQDLKRNWGVEETPYPSARSLARRPEPGESPAVDRIVADAVRDRAATRRTRAVEKVTDIDSALDYRFGLTTVLYDGPRCSAQYFTPI